MSLGLHCSAWEPYLPDTSFEEPQWKESRQKDVHVIVRSVLENKAMVGQASAWEKEVPPCVN